MDGISVDIRYLDAINWQQDTGLAADLSENTEIWRVNINANFSLIPRFLNLLEPDEIKRANRYYQEKDRQRFIVSRAALRIILSRHLNQPADAIRFAIGSNKKPFLKDNDGIINYNLSHSDAWAVIAISKNAVGIDTEKIDPTFAYADILPDNFSKEEINYIEQEEQHHRFYLLWTRKEATTKLTGQGLNERLKLLPSINGKHLTNSIIINSTKDITLSSFKLDAVNLATIASETNNTSSLIFSDIDLTSI